MAKKAQDEEHFNSFLVFNYLLVLMTKVRPSSFSFLKKYYFLGKNEAMTFSSSLLNYLLLNYIVYLLVFS